MDQHAAIAVMSLTKDRRFGGPISGAHYNVQLNPGAEEEARVTLQNDLDFCILNLSLEDTVLRQATVDTGETTPFGISRNPGLKGSGQAVSKPA